MKKKYTATEVRTLILDSATQLFATNGFEQTKVQDIMNPLGGLTKGAFYHHFNSKEEVADQVIERLLPNKEVFDEVMNNDSLNGLRKIQELFLASMFDESVIMYSTWTSELLKYPRFFLKYIEYVNELLVPYIEQMLIEGNKDLSLSSENNQQTAELIILVLSTWFVSAIFPNTTTTFNEKILVSRRFLKNSNLDILDDYVINRMNEEMLKLIDNSERENYEKNI